MIAIALGLALALPTFAILSPAAAHAAPYPCPTFTNTGTATELLTVHLFAATEPLTGSDYFTITATHNGSPGTTCTTSATTTTLWVDPSTLVKVSGSSSNSPSIYEEWCIAGPAGSCTDQSFGVGSSGTDSVTLTYYGQVYAYYAYTTNDVSTPSDGPDVKCPVFGLQTTITDISTSGTGKWCDTLSTAYTPDSTIGGPAEQWVDNGTGFTLSSAFADAYPGSYNVVFSYFHQFSLAFSYQTIGVGSPTAPTLACTQSGSPFSASLTGTPTAYWCDAGSAWGVTNPLSPSGPNNRWQTPTTTTGTVTAHLTQVFKYYHQTLVTLEIQAVAQPTWGFSGMTATVTGNVYQVHGTILCTVFTVSTHSVDDCGPVWVDAGSSVTFPGDLTLNGACTNCRWQTNGGLPYDVAITGPGTYAVPYYKQWTNPFDYALDAGQTGSPNIQLWCNEEGAYSDAGTLTTSSNGFWCDNGATAHSSNPSLDSTATEQFITTSNTVGPIISGGNALHTFLYYHQFALNYSYMVFGGGSPTAPTLTCTNLDVTSTPTLTGTPTVYWCDQSDASDPLNGGINGGWTVTNPLVPSTGTERWYTNQFVGPAAVTTPLGPTEFDYYHQFQVYFSFTTSDGTTPTLTGDVAYFAFGSWNYGVTPTQSPGSTGPYWVDAGWSVYYFQYYNSADERYAGTVGYIYISAPVTTDPTMYHQFEQYISYSLVGGGVAPPAPTLTCYQFGSSGVVGTLAMTPTDDWWCDAAQSWSVTNPLSGATSSIRYDSSQTTSGTVTAASTTNFVYYYQFNDIFKYKVNLGGSGYGNPTVHIIEWGSPNTVVATTLGTAAWVDTSTTYTYDSTLPGSGSWERWYASVPSGNLGSTVTTILMDYVHQYYLTINSSGPGHTSLATSNWYNAGSKLKVTAFPNVGHHLLDWTKTVNAGTIGLSSTVAKTITITVNGGGIVTANFV